MITSPLRRLVAATTATLLSTSLLLLTPTAARADAVPVPQAPVLSVIPRTQPLTFTLAGGDPIQTAVLTGDTATAQADWVGSSTVDLSTYEGQTVRVLARRVGVTNPDLYFDATYQVRDTYAPGVGLGTEANPVTAIGGDSAAITGWATGYSDYVPGTNVADHWKVPERAVGQVGGDDGDPYAGNTDVVVLGDHGRITLTFGSPIRDGAGADFAVFENGFRVSQTSVDFVELGYVEVSSNGTDFVRFDTGTSRETPVSGYEGTRVSDFGGVAGKDLNGYGTPFDLRTLKNRAEVRAGTLDLGAITHVRIVDIVGDGNDLDSFGQPIYDPFPTWGSGGFDLRGVGVIHQSGASVSKTSAARASATSAQVSSTVTPGVAGAQAVRLEWSTREDHADATTRGTATVAADAGSTALTFDVDGIVDNLDYFYRVVATSPGGTEVSSGWKTFTTIVPVIFRERGYSLTDEYVFDVVVKPGTRGSQSVYVEYQEFGWDWETFVHGGIGPVFRTRVKIAPGDRASSTLRWRIPDLEPQTQYRATIVAADGEGEPTPVVLDHDVYLYYGQEAPYIQTPEVVDVAGTGATVLNTVTPGSYGPQTIHLEYTANADHSDPQVHDDVHDIVGDEYYDDAPFQLVGLTPGAEYAVRVVTTADLDGTRFESEWVDFTAAELTAALGEPTAEVTGVADATITVPVDAGDFDRSITVEHSIDADHGDAVSSAAQDVTAGSAATDLSFDLTGLDSHTEYSWRVVSTSAGAEETTAWASFTTDPVRAQVADPTVGSIGPKSATISTIVTPGDLEQEVVLQYTTNADHAGATSTAPTSVAGGSAATAVDLDVSALAPNTTFYHRVVATAADGVQVSSDWATFTTSEIAAPTVALSVDDATVETGDTVTLTWSATGADAVTASGGWTGSKAVAGGTEQVQIDDAGTHTFTLVATGEGGSTTGTVTVRVDHPATTLDVSVPRTPTFAGRWVPLAVDGLAPGEAYRVTVSGIEVASGAATADGTVREDVTVPKVLAAGSRSITVRGSTEQRAGSTSVRIVARAKLSLGLLKKQARKKTAQRVTVTGLAPHEPVRLYYRGRRIASATADADGTFTRRFAVGGSTGRKTVVVVGLDSTRRGARTFEVVR